MNCSPTSRTTSHKLKHDQARVVYKCGGPQINCLAIKCKKTYSVTTVRTQFCCYYLIWNMNFWILKRYRLDQRMSCCTDRTFKSTHYNEALRGPKMSRWLWHHRDMSKCCKVVVRFRFIMALLYCLHLSVDLPNYDKSKQP